MRLHACSSVSIFLSLLSRSGASRLARGIRVVVIPLALSDKEEMKQSKVLIEDKSSLINLAVLLVLLFLVPPFFEAPPWVKCKDRRENHNKSDLPYGCAFSVSELFVQNQAVIYFDPGYTNRCLNFCPCMQAGTWKAANYHMNCSSSITAIPLSYKKILLVSSSMSWFIHFNLPTRINEEQQCPYFLFTYFFPFFDTRIEFLLASGSYTYTYA